MVHVLWPKRSRGTPRSGVKEGTAPFPSRAVGTDHLEGPSYGLASFCPPLSRHRDGVELQRRTESLMRALPSEPSATEGSSIVYCPARLNPARPRSTRH